MYRTVDFPGGLVVKNPPANAGDAGSIPGLGRSPGEGNGNPLQYSCLKNPMDRGAWQTAVHGLQRVGYNLVTKQHFLNILCSFVKVVTSVRNVLPPTASTNQHSEPR